jgi:hypothetical protein
MSLPFIRKRRGGQRLARPDLNEIVVRRTRPYRRRFDQPEARGSVGLPAKTGLFPIMHLIGIKKTQNESSGSPGCIQAFGDEMLHDARFLAGCDRRLAKYRKPGNELIFTCCHLARSPCRAG